MQVTLENQVHPGYQELMVYQAREVNRYLRKSKCVVLQIT